MTRLPRLRMVAAQDRAELGPLLALTLLVALTSFLLAAVPRQLAAAEDAALGAALARADQAELELGASTTNTEPVGQLQAVDEQLRADLRPALRGRVAEPVRTATSDLFDTYTLDGEHLRPQPFSWLQLAYQPGLLDGVEWVDGEAPTADGPTRVSAGEDGRVPVLRVALEAELAQVLDLAVGRTYLVRPLSPQPGGVGSFALQLSGTFEPAAPDDARWDYLSLVTEKGERYTPEGALQAEVGAVLVDETQAARLQDAVGTLRYDWHYPVDPGTTRPGDVDAVLAAVRSSISTASSATIPQRRQTYTEPTVSMGSGLVALLETHLASSRATASVVAVGVAGIAVVALLVLSLAALVVVLRRSPVLTLARARGASVAQVVLVVAVGVGVAVVPAAVAGGLLARSLVGSDAGARDLLLAAAVGVWAVLSCALATWWGARTARPRGLVRPVAEGALVVVAVAGVVLLRSRGVGAASGGGVDPLLAAVPVLVALAVALVLLRAAPPLVARLAAARSRARGLVSFLGLARAARQPAVLAAPLAALLVALCFAVFAAGAVRTVDDAQVRDTWRVVGGDYRLQATFFEPEITEAVRDLEGVTAVAPAYVRTDAQVVPADGPEVAAISATIDAEAYADVLADAPGVADLDAVRALTKDPGEDEPLPVLVTTRAEDALDPAEPVVDLGGGLGPTPVSVRTTTARFPLDDGRLLVVADLGAVQAREPSPVRPNTLVVAGRAGLADELAAIADRTGQDTTLLDRRAELEQVQASPFVGSTRDLFALAVPVATGFALLATWLGLVLAAPTRRRDTAVLRRLGTSPRESLRLTLTEQAPLTLAMLLGGALAGLGLVSLALGAVDLSPLTGGVGPPEVSLPLVAATVLTGGLLVLVAGATALVSAAERRRPDAARHDGGDR